MNEEKYCTECGNFLPVLNGKCEVCLSGPELEEYEDITAQEEMHFSCGTAPCLS